jgi:hypothetical protein
MNTIVARLFMTTSCGAAGVFPKETMAGCGGWADVEENLGADFRAECVTQGDAAGISGGRVEARRSSLVTLKMLE